LGHDDRLPPHALGSPGRRRAVPGARPGARAPRPARVVRRRAGPPARSGAPDAGGVVVGGRGCLTPSESDTGMTARQHPVWCLTPAGCLTPTNVSRCRSVARQRDACGQRQASAFGLYLGAVTAIAGAGCPYITGKPAFDGAAPVDAVAQDGSTHAYIGDRVQRIV